MDEDDPIVIELVDENGLPHSETSPALVLSSGAKYWMIHGELSRTDGPAIESPDGFFAYYFDGSRHRGDGPAIIMPGGEVAYFYYGYQADSKDVFENIMWRKDILLRCSGVDPSVFKDRFREVYGDESDKSDNDDDEDE